MNESDIVRLRHMRDAALEVQSFIQGKTRETLDTDQLLVRALSMSVGIIGETASRIDQETRDTFPQLPWSQIIGMRNRLIHAYFEVNLDILWKVASEEVLPLIATLEKIIPSGDNDMSTT